MLAVRQHLSSGLKRALFRASEIFGITPRRVRAIWFGEVSRVWADELDLAREWFTKNYQRTECTGLDELGIRERLRVIRGRIGK